jgi:hypothetical protein
MTRGGVTAQSLLLLPYRACALHILVHPAYIDEIVGSRGTGFSGPVEPQKSRTAEVAAPISVDHREEEIAMARSIFAGLTLAAAMMIHPHAADAAPYWPWCSQYDQSPYAHACAFSSWEQCMQTVRGIGGWCYTNPYPPPPAPTARSARPRRHVAHN